MEIKPIAYFRSPFPGKFGIPRQAGLAPALRGRIVFEPAYRSADALRGLEGFDYLWLIWEFSSRKTPERSEAVEPPELAAPVAPVIASVAEVPIPVESTGLAAPVEEAIVRFVEGKGGAYRVADVVAEFGNPARGYSQDYLEVLRHLIDDGVVPPPGG